MTKKRTNTKKEIERCKATLPELGYLARPVQCLNKGKFIEDNKRVCGIHCAAAVRKRYERSVARYSKINGKIIRTRILLNMAEGLTIAELKKCHITFKR